MPKYNSYEDWQRQQQARFKTQVQEDISGDELRIGEPLDFPIRKIGETPEPEENWVDKNSLYDFLGNVAWGFGETFLAPTVLDIASEVREEGIFGTKDLSAEFGSQDWKDESWMGRAGYMVGTAGGILTGIGAVGKGLSLLSKTAGAGTKQAAKQLVKESAEHFSDDVAKSVIKSTRSNIDEAVKTAKKGTNLFQFSARASLKHNPLGDDLVYNTVQKNVREDLVKALGMKADDPALEGLTKSVLKEASQSRSKHFGHSIGYKLKGLGMNPKLAQLSGDIVYEAALLGAWDTIAGEIGGDLAANLTGLDESQWQFEDWYHRAAHGMMIGSVLAPLRYIPGGKQVAFGKSGMVADLNHMRRFLVGRYAKSGKGMTDNQLKAFANSVTITSGNPINVKGMNEAFLQRTSGKKILSPEEREIYERAFNFVRADLPRLTRKLAGEIARDGYTSFTRASVGSFAMNASAYKQFYENSGVFPGMHEDYPLSKLAADHWVGMLYMKRGKVFEGKPAMPRFFDQTGMEANGSEIARMINSMNVLGKDDITLDLYNRFANNTLEGGLKEGIDKGVMEGDLDARQIVDSVRKEFVTGAEYVERLETNTNLDHWAVQTRKEISEKEVRLDKLRKEGKDKEADGLDLELKKLRGALSMAVDLSGMALFGYDGSLIRPMDRKEALDFVESLNKIRLDDGTPLTPENFPVLENRIEKAKLKVTEQIRNLGMNYISESLKTLDLIDADAGQTGKLLIHKSIMDGLYSLRAHSEKNKTTGELERPYEDAAGTLIEAIENAKNAGLIELGDKGLEYSTQELLKDANLKDFVDIHKLNTENLHEMVFNSKSPESSWREKMPGWSGKEGFFDAGILGRTPIWHSIQTANLYKQSRMAYEGFTDRKGDFYSKIYGKLKGNEIFKVVEKEGDELPAILEESDLVFHNNLTHLLKLLNKEGHSGSQEITVGELKTISTDTFNEFGNILSDPAAFTAFNRFLYKNLINDMTGNSSITTGMRNVIKNGLDPESLLTIRDHGLVFRSAKALRESLAAREDISESQRVKLNEMISRYESEIEIPLRDSMRNGSMIRFEDRVIDTTIPGNDAGELIQNIRESLNQVNKFSFIEMGETQVIHSEISSTIAELTGLLTLDMKASKELTTELVNLAEAGRGLTDLMNVYIANNDVIGLRHLFDSKEKLNIFNEELSTSMPKDTKSIQKYKKTLERYINDAIDRRNEALEITDMQQLDDFYKEKIDRISLSDRSNRPHQGNTSISTNQYESKWHLPEDFAKSLTENPKSVMDALGLLADPILARSSIFNHDLWKTGIGAVLKGSYTPKDYIDIVIEPVVSSMRAKIEAAPDYYKGKSNKSAAELYEDFVIDTYFIVQSGMSSKKLPIFTFENGVGRISESNVSNWDVGINKLANSLGLTEHGSISLFGRRVGAERGFTSNLTPKLRAEMFAMIESGVMIDLETSNVLRSGDMEILNKFKLLVEGRGKDGGTEFIPVQLDEKTLIVIPAIKAKAIARAWHSRESDLRQNLEFVLNSTVGNATRSRELVENYLEREVGATFNEVGEMSIELSNPNIQKLVMLTRLLNAFPNAVPDVMNNTMSVKDGLSTLKYIKLDSPRGGMALNERTLGVAKEFLPRFLEDGSNLQKAYDIFNSHFFDSEGNPTRHRTVNIFDEKGDSRGFFDSSRVGRRVLQRQIAENNPKLSAEEINARVEHVMEGYDKITASVQNAEKYLSLPEMVGMLMTKGARRDWFVWNEAGDPIGFNVAIKPIEMYSKIDRATGEIVTSVGKTAYKYHPDMDALMHVNGDYFLDSIGFESSHKIHRRFNTERNEWESPGIVIESSPVDDWQSGMRFSRNQAESQRMEIDRGAIFIKSISGIHDATVAFGFSNLLSNDAQRHLNNVTNVNKTIEGMTTRYAQLAENPFAYKHIAQQLVNWQGESGDAIGRLTGVESVLAVNGLPLFEFMMPHIDRMITSEFMGTRNLTSSAVENGSYSVMTSGPGLSQPERRNNIQYTFGGSGIPHAQWEKPVAGLLTKGGEEGLNFIFKVTPNLIKKFKMEGILEPGHDILVSHDGEVMSPHLSAEWKVRDSKTAKIMSSFERGMNEYHEQVIKLIKENPAISSLGDVALFLNGTLQMGGISDMTHKLNNKLGVTPSKAAIYNKIKEGNKPVFQSIHVENTDLRQPKPGLNDWVITRIEKLLDKRRGPVSEMNLLDVIDPQDADFDLDKSSSLHALPGKVLKEIYNVSGYFSPAENAFDTILEEIVLTQHMDIHKHADALAALERKRPSLIRQQSILSNLLQYFSTVARKGGQEYFIPGDNANRMLQRGNKGFFISELDTRRDTYRISLREGSELADSMGYMKKLIKATMDIYKTKQAIETVDLDRLMWEHPEFGLLKVTSEKDGYNAAIPWNSAPKEVRSTLNNLVNGILKPIGDIYNLNRMTDNFSDGTSRKMTAFEMVYKYEQALAKIRYAGYEGDGQLGSFSNGLLEFLGNNHFKGQSTTGLSEQPLIKALVALRKGMSKSFLGDPSTIPHDSGLAEIMAGKDKTGQDITNAIAGIIKDEKNMAQITAVQYRSEQIKDIISSLRASRRLNSSMGRYWEKQLDIHMGLINEFNLQINDPQTIYNNKIMTAKHSKGSGFTTEVTRVYRKVGDEVKVVKTYNKNEKIFWSKGDVLVENPKTIVAGNDVISRSRRSMHDAFARIDSRISSNEYQIIESLYNKFEASIIDVGNRFVDPTSPKTSGRLGNRAEAELAVLSDYLTDVGNISPSKSSYLQRQFLYRLLTPKASLNVFDVVGWDPNTKQKKLFPHLNQNKRNERLVFKFLQRAMGKNAETIVSQETATEWHQAINDRFKAAYIRQYSPTIEANVFNFEQTSRSVKDFSLMSKADQLPKFVYEINLNEKAKDVLQSYVNGTYFLDPIEAYRLTVDLRKKSIEGLPNMEGIGDRIERLWEGTDNIQLGKGKWYEPGHSFRRESYHNPEKGAKENMNDALRKQFKECF